jgi:hypothetical protein
MLESTTLGTMLGHVLDGVATRGNAVSSGASFTIGINWLNNVARLRSSGKTIGDGLWVDRETLGRDLGGLSTLIEVDGDWKHIHRKVLWNLNAGNLGATFDAILDNLGWNILSRDLTSDGAGNLGWDRGRKGRGGEEGDEDCSSGTHDRCTVVREVKD